MTAPEVPAQREVWSEDGSFTLHSTGALPGAAQGLSVPCWLPTTGTTNTPKPRGCFLRILEAEKCTSHWVTQPASGGLGNRPVPIDVGTVVAPGSPGASSGARPHRGHAAVTPFALVLAWPAGRNRGLTHRGWAPPVPPSFRRSLGLSVRPRTGSARPNADDGHGLPSAPFSPPRRSGAARAAAVWLKEEEPGSRAVPVSKISLFLGGSVAMSRPQPPRAEIKEQRAPGRAAPALVARSVQSAAGLRRGDFGAEPRAQGREFPKAVAGSKLWCFVGEVLAEARETEPRGEGMAALDLP